MGFVIQNGRPLQMVAAGGSPQSPQSPAAASFPMLPFLPVLTRPDPPPDGYGHTNVGKVRYIQPSCTLSMNYSTQNHQWLAFLFLDDYLIFLWIFSLIQATVRNTPTKKFGLQDRRHRRCICFSTWALSNRKHAVVTSCTSSVLNCVFSSSPRYEIDRNFPVTLVSVKNFVEMPQLDILHLLSNCAQSKQTSFESLFRFALFQGEAQPSGNFGLEFFDSSSASGNQEPPIQPLRAAPFFDPLTPSDEEKIRVSVHNYTRALKRNRGTSHRPNYYVLVLFCFDFSFGRAPRVPWWCESPAVKTIVVIFNAL